MAGDENHKIAQNSLGRTAEKGDELVENEFGGAGLAKVSRSGPRGDDDFHDGWTGFVERKVGAAPSDERIALDRRASAAGDPSFSKKYHSPPDEGLNGDAKVWLTDLIRSTTTTTSAGERGGRGRTKYIFGSAAKGGKDSAEEVPWRRAANVGSGSVRSQRWRSVEGAAAYLVAHMIGGSGGQAEVGRRPFAATIKDGIICMGAGAIGQQGDAREESGRAAGGSEAMGADLGRTRGGIAMLMIFLATVG